MIQVRLSKDMTPIFEELARVGAPHPLFTGRPKVYIARKLIEQSPCFIEAKAKLDQTPPKQIGKKR